MSFLEHPIQLTQRDIDILTFINDFGFCELEHIQCRFRISKGIGYRLLNRLIKSKLVSHQRIFHLKSGVYYLTQKGAKHTPLPPLRLFPIARYQHQKALLNTYFKLISSYPNASWISERTLKHDKFKDGVGKFGHVADGVLVLEDDRKVAIEVELTCKGNDRIKEILQDHAAQFHFHEVWYFALPDVAKKLKKLAADMSFVKIYHLGE